ncbi:tetratricopeptide repeat protein [Kordia algicida OT-1]|uniref:Tetratricopeptide TPR_4 n=1 Tax=Kordia algicida OT-1 TaxID=391587 RepID=A9DL84_9FLAO|nr:tetratricopeptide repeat protein [Kordia algicida]EDP98504.1 Tetratricopeptide TPR_4 [Kordia algicida OT-1]
MKKLITLFAILFIYNSSFAQKENARLKFDKKYYEAVDKWVAFIGDEENAKISVGFIYIDQQAGFTMNYECDILPTPDGVKKIATPDTINLKLRLTPNAGKVAILTPIQRTALELPEQPDWLKIYKRDAQKVSYLTRIGYHYNHVGASQFALKPLLKAYEKDPHFQGLEFELSYAYNALEQFEKAIPVLKKAIENNPENYYFYRELGYSYKNLNRIEDAEAIYQRGILLSDNDFEKSEMAVNMAQTYFQLRNREKFDIWAKLTREFAEEGSRYAQFIDIFESNWDKK